jgi:hypothetical protein
MRKDVILAVLATFCLTCTLFMVSTTRSATNPYDPWLDYDENGTIGLSDLVRLAQSYGTLGDSTKNVTIAEHANKLAYYISGQSVPAGSYWESDWINVDGYSKVTICLYTSALECQFRLLAHHNGLFWFVVDAQNGTINHDFVKTYDVPNKLIRISFYNYDSLARYLSFDVYVIP